MGVKNKFWSVLALCLGFGGFANGQLIKATQVKAVASPPVFSSLLNSPTKRESVKQDLVSISAGTKLINLDAQTSIINLVTAKEKMSILYGVPVRVGIDRYLLQSNVEEHLSEVLDLKTHWENLSESKRNQMVYDYLHYKISKEELEKALSSPTMPDAVVQQMVKVLQDQINQLQGVLDNLYYNCPPVEFKSMAPTVKADLRFNSPVSGKLGFMRANGNGQVNLSNLFDNIPFGALESNPVSGTLLIYTK